MTQVTPQALSGVSTYPKTGQFSNLGIIKQKTIALPLLQQHYWYQICQELCLLLSMLSLGVFSIF